MTADELIAYIRGAVSATTPGSDSHSQYRAVNAIRSAIDRYYSEKNGSDAMDRYMRKAIPNDVQKAANYSANLAEPCARQILA